MANVLANAGRAIITNRLGGGGTTPQYLGWGTGAGTSAAADTTLFTETQANLSGTTGTRVTGTTSQQTTSVTNDTFQVSGTITATAGGTTTNAGVFDNSTIGSGNLFMKGDYTGVALNSGDSISYTFKLQFT